MQQLSSKNYDHYEVWLRGIDQPYILNPARGAGLSAYLAKPENRGTHVMLNDNDGNQIQVSTYEITKVIPVQSHNVQESLQEALNKWKNEN